MGSINRRRLLKWSAAASIGGLIKDSAMASTNDRLYVPPEEAEHELTFMQWPVSLRVHPELDFLDDLQDTIARIANTISRFEPVIMLAGKEHHRAARKSLSSAVELWNIPTEDLWCRDSGPLFAINTAGQRVISHIRFNGWGGKQVHRHDSAIPVALAERLGIAVVSSGVVGEAGGVDHDGHGLMIAHESSWLNDNRNPGLSRDEIERKLLDAYGADEMIWSPGVWGEDITDYHIDSLARFTAARRVIVNLPNNPDLSDPFHVAALETHDRLAVAGLDVDVIPEPTSKRVNSIDFVASYVNYYVCNGAVISAQFGDEEADAVAGTALARHYSGREVIALNADALGEVGGGIHCATQQMPA